MTQTCGQCKHWKRTHDPNDLRAENGECREGPPSMTILPASNGGKAMLVGYLTLPAKFEACDRFAERVLVAEK